ncbi:hypothetical protein FH972_027292 [Carpinus fangiana]|uniref:Uncharacterized protein n=1 Tax=Carpinus fangiana TaxID=176857 RepID=A0A5N6LJ09_9ROSI|nr:hypothetical protein FH972_027292 [Carpinus fangiana]
MARKGATTVDFVDSRDQIAFNLAHTIWGGGSNEEYWKGLKLKNKWEKALVSARLGYFGNGHLSAKNKWEKPIGISVGCLCLAKNKRRNGL